MPSNDVPAHEQAVTHRYTVVYPEHGPRDGDPAYVDFEHYRKAHIATARCAFAVERGGDDSECDKEHPLELHHSHVEWAMLNEVDMALLEPRYPGISKSTLGKWAETGQNLEFRCRFHHRGPGGVHNASVSDYEAEHFVRGLIT